MKKILTIATLAVFSTPAFALDAFEEEAYRIKGLLHADAEIIDEILDAHKAEWNSTGVFQVWGFTDGDSDSQLDLAEAYTEVESMGLTGGAIAGVTSNADGTIRLQVLEGKDFIATDSSGYLNNPSYNKRLDGAYIIFVPFQLQLDGAKVTVNAASENDEVQISGYTCRTFGDDMSTVRYDLFKAFQIIDTNGSDAGGLTERLVSFAHLLDAPFDLCSSTATYSVP